MPLSEMRENRVKRHREALMGAGALLQQFERPPHAAYSARSSCGRRPRRQATQLDEFAPERVMDLAEFAPEHLNAPCSMRVLGHRPSVVTRPVTSAKKERG
jgi:hypothetical protein